MTRESKIRLTIGAVAVLGVFGASIPLSAEVEVSVQLVAPRSADAPSEITLVAEPMDVSAGDLTEMTREFSVGPGEWTLDLPASRRWRLRPVAPGYWGREVEIDEVTPGEVIQLRLWRAGVVRGGLIVARGETVPPRVRLKLEGDAYSRQGGELPEAQVRCPVVEDRWRCEVPAGTLNLVLAAGLFVPQYVWEVVVEPDQVVDLGDFELELGGSITGRVELDDRSVPSEECQVRLVTFQEGAHDRSILVPARVDRDGNFLFEGIPARQYVLTASQPDYVPFTSSPVAVSPGAYVEVAEALVLRRPATLELVFSPPTGPGGQGWRFGVTKLDPEGGRSSRAYTGESGLDGIWKQEDMVPGSYEISLRDKARLLFSQEIELPAGTSTVPVELPVLLVEGHVLAGEEPLAAKVTLSRQEDGQRASFQSDEYGIFEGVLPGEGLWEARVDAPAERIRATLDPIEVRAQGSSGVAVIEIRLPGTVLEGEVTDLYGNALDQATVRIQRRGPVAGTESVKTDAEGRFRIRGIAPGSISVMAQDGRRRSQWFHLVLEEGRPVPPLQLVVR
jgi:hypothetical protein